jgi:thiol-disulfide isomerase/thioredoxin
MTSGWITTRKSVFALAVALGLGAGAGAPLDARAGTKRVDRAPAGPAASTQAPLAPAKVSTILEAVKQPGARAVLLNVWASWCDPCREEMPDLVRFYRKWKDRGVRLVLVSADTREDKAAAEAFLASQGIDFPSFLKDDDDTTFIDSIDKRWNGTLPASFLFDGTGKQRQLWQKAVDLATLERALGEILPAPTPAQKGEKR